MRFFNNCATLNELKAEYRRLTKIHHPDHGGETATMAAINSEYAERFEILKDEHNRNADAEHQTTETADEFRDIIDVLIRLNLTVELCGCWLWISGDTRAVREQLKTAGCRWSSSKKMWYWRHKEDGAHWSRGKKTMDQIRNKYGSQTFTGSRSAAIEA